MSANKKQRTHPQYELLYWPTIPGRGEFIRLAFEVAGVPYTDVGNESKEGGKIVFQACNDTKSTGDAAGNPPSFAPPALRVPGEGPDGGVLFLSQTGNILFYLGEKLGLAGERDVDKWYVNSLALTALDLNNEVHDTHHPIKPLDYYEEQKTEALAKATDFRAVRLPKFLSYFERVLAGNAERFPSSSNDSPPRLVGSTLTYADTTLWHVLDGLRFAFPKEMSAREEEFPLCGRMWRELKEKVPELKRYLASERRLGYSNGIFRHYPELDRQE